MAKKEKRPDPRIRRTRHLIREAFLDLLAEEGYDAITIQAITDRAMVNRGTFYLHYVDKQDLLNQCIEEVLQELVDFHQSDTFPEVPPAARMVYFYEHVARHAHFYKILLADLRLPVFTARLSEIIQEVLAQALAQFQPDERALQVEKDVLISYLTGAQISVLIWWLNHEMAYTSQYMAKQLLQLAGATFFHAIGRDALPTNALQ